MDVKYIIEFCNGLKVSVYFSIFLLSMSSFAQFQITIEATILDRTTDQPIPYVNVAFKDQKLKTITNSNGKFILSYDEEAISADDILRFSAFGYQPTQTTVSVLYKLLKNTDKIYLVRETFPTIENAVEPATTKDIGIKPEYIRGTVTSSNLPLQGVIVKIKNTLVEAQTDVNGNYSIAAKKNQVLVFNFIGMKSVEISVGDHQNIDIQLETDATILDEVELFGEKKKAEKLIDLGLGGKKSFDALGYDVKIMTTKDIKPHYNNLFDLLNGQFAGVVMGYDEKQNPIVYIPGRQGSINNNAAAIFDIDGQIFASFPPMDVQQIETIAIIKSLAGTNKYGSEGRGGVVVIRTKIFSATKAEAEKPSALVTGNDYNENLLSINTLAPVPIYLQSLQNATTFEDAKDVYITLKQDKENLSIPFYLNVAEYFLRWNAKYALDILSYAEGLAKDNPKALKTIAYKYEELNKLENALLVYQRIAKIRPKDSQSYRDLAWIYSATGFYSEAMRLYKQMLNTSIEGVDFTGIQQTMTEELMHLLALHRSEVQFTDLPGDLLTARFKQDLRIVFEWNDPNAEFELQFVNPQKKFYKGSHTKFNNRERMLDEIKNGYTTEAYIIDDAEAGEWIINIESLNEEPSINPNYLKYTIFKNYGLENETKTVKVIQLHDIKQKVMLDTFMYR